METDITRYAEMNLGTVEGAEPSEVISEVKEALKEAQQTNPQLGLAFESVGLDLITVRTKEAGGEFKLKVPFTEWELGVEGGVSKEHTTAISVVFEPAPPQADEAITGIKAELTRAIMSAADVANSVKQDHPDLALREASAKLEFVYSRAGGASLLPFSGKLGKVTTHTLTLDLKRA
jgi:Trypsin-co-occurring domain 2